LIVSGTPVVSSKNRGPFYDKRSGLEVLLEKGLGDLIVPPSSSKSVSSLSDISSCE
jgi:hypothetical protein